MSYLDLVERWIVTTTARTLDQHAADPIPAAAALPESADQLRRTRDDLLHAVEALRTWLINGDDLTAPADAAMWRLSSLRDLARDHQSLRVHIGLLVDDPDRTTYVATHPVRPVRRRYVNPGDTVLTVLPHLDVCRKLQLAGRPVRVRIYESDAELQLDGHPEPVVLPHAAAGIYRDHVESRLYILQVAATVDERTGLGC